MMYYINKLVWYLASPTNLIFVLCVAGVAMSGLRRERAARVGRIGLWIGLVLMWVWASAPMTRLLGLSLEREWLVDGRVPRVETFPTADAIVLLGGSMYQATNVTDYAEMWTSADRVWQAARLYKAGKAPLIFVTGEGNARATQGLLMDFGVPTNALAFAEKARNTEEEAREISRRGLKKVLLVTSAWHMKRAKLMFEKYAKGVEIVPAPADFEATALFAEGFKSRELLPSGGSLAMNEYYFHEWLGYLGYKYLR